MSNLPREKEWTRGRWDFSNNDVMLTHCNKIEKKKNSHYTHSHTHTHTHESFRIKSYSLHFWFAVVLDFYERRKQNCYKYSVLSLRCSNHETRLIALYTPISSRSVFFCDISCFLTLTRCVRCQNCAEHNNIPFHSVPVIKGGKILEKYV